VEKHRIGPAAPIDTGESGALAYDDFSKQNRDCRSARGITRSTSQRVIEGEPDA